MKPSMTQNKDGIAKHIYSSIKIYGIIIVTTLSLVILYIFINNTIKQLQSISHDINNMGLSAQSIQSQLKSTKQTINAYIGSAYVKQGKINPDRILAAAKWNGASIKFIKSAFVAMLPNYKHYAYRINFDKNKKHKVSIDRLLKKGQSYQQTNWFQTVKKNPKVHITPIIENSKKNIFNSGIKYIFPIYSNMAQSPSKAKMIGMGGFIVPNRQFIRNFIYMTKSTSGSINEKANTVMYYKALYRNNQDEIKNVFVQFSPKQKIAESIPKRCINQQNQWQYCNGTLYKKASYLNGAFTLVIRFDIHKTILKALLTVFICILLLTSLGYYLLRVRIRNKLHKLIAPITELAEHAIRIASKDALDKPFQPSDPKALEVREVDYLTKSFERMRINLINYIDEETELLKYKSQLGLASSIQQNFIKHDRYETFKMNGLYYKVRCLYKPAAELSGDVYDFVSTQNDLYCLIGDSTGKNLSAAVFSLFVLSRFTSLAEQSYEPAQIISSVNNYLCNMNTNNMFMSALCIRIDMKNKRLQIANAGHDQPILLDHSCQKIDTSNYKPHLVLGLQNDIEYHQQEFNLENIKNIFCYTDGISEARNPSGETFDGDAIVDTVADCAYENSLAVAVKDRIEAYEDPSLRDDKTIVSIEVIKQNTSKNHDNTE